MYSRIVKSKRILTKFHVLDYEYICDRIAIFHKKILFITRVTSLQLCGQLTVLTLTPSTTRFGGSCRSVCTAARFVTSTS